jgi:fermentation-respiration switch protein FrsA (DUF1100 family)
MLSLVVCLIAGAALAISLLWLFQRQLMYAPASGVPSAGALLAGRQEVTFATEDGLWLAGWYVPATRAAGGAQPPTTVLIFNGNGGNRGYRARMVSALTQAGAAVFVFDYRGYGGNPGSPTEAGLLADARAARAYLLGRSDVDPARLVYLGESLGAAVALGLAVEQPPAALILRSPFTSMVEMARLSYPFLPVDLLVWDRYPSLERIERVAAPLLVVAGTGDRLIPSSQSERLYERAAAPKRLVLVPGADHNDASLAEGPPLVEAVTQFLAERGL